MNPKLTQRTQVNFVIGQGSWCRQNKCQPMTEKPHILDRFLFIWTPFWFIRLPIWNSQNCSMFPLAFVAGWLQGHWWGFISRNYVVWPIFLHMNVFIALKGSHFWFLFRVVLLHVKEGGYPTRIQGCSNNSPIYTQGKCWNLWQPYRHLFIVLFIAGKILAKSNWLACMNILTMLKFYQKSQCGIRKAIRLIDMILSARNFQQKYQKQNIDLKMTFVDSVSFWHSQSWWVLEKLWQRLAVQPGL